MSYSYYGTLGRTTLIPSYPIPLKYLLFFSITYLYLFVECILVPLFLALAEFVLQLLLPEPSHLLEVVGVRPQVPPVLLRVLVTAPVPSQLIETQITHQQSIGHTHIPKITHTPNNKKDSINDDKIVIYL